MCARGIHHSSKQSVISGLIQNHECVLNTTGQASCRKTPAMPGGWQEQRCRRGVAGCTSLPWQVREGSGLFRLSSSLGRP